MKKIYNVKIEPLTAVHIGTGEEITPLDYNLIETKQGNIVYCKYSSDFVLEHISESGDERLMAEFENASSHGDMKILQQFFHSNVKNDDIEYFCKVTSEFEKLFNKNKNVDPLQNACVVNQMFRSAGSAKPVIPGSSIKGSIRTALLNSKLSNINDKEYYRLLNSIEKVDNDFSPKKNYAKLEQPIQKALFGHSDAKNDPMRTVVFSDTIFSSKNTQIVSLLENVAIDKNQEELKPVGMQIIAEALKGNLLEGDTVGESKIIIDEDLQKESHISTKISIRDIINDCNYFFKREFDEEYEKFYKPCSNGLDIVLKLKKQISEIAEQKNQFIFRVGRWSQVEFVTFEENFRRPKTPKRNGKSQGYGGTRTLLEYNGNFVPMGWCKCTVENLD